MKPDLKQFHNGNRNASWMTSRPRRGLRAAMVLGLLVLNRGVAADMPPMTWIHSVVQEGQDVKIRLEQDTNEYFSPKFDLIRVQDGVETSVQQSAHVKTATAAAVENLCSGDDRYTESTAQFCSNYPEVCLTCPEVDDEMYTCIGADCDSCIPVEADFYIWSFPDPESFCDDYPTYHKVDCDDDDIPDCCRACGQGTYYYDFWDECVSPGHTTYRIESETNDDEAEIMVLENESDCWDNGDGGCGAVSVSYNADHSSRGIRLVVLLMQL